MKKIFDIWQRYHQRFLEEEKERLGFPGPASVLRHYNSFGFYFQARSVWDFAACRPGDRVLLVGDAGGNDYWFFRFNGITGEVVDVAPQALIGDAVVIHDISAAELPFAPASFDVIVMCNVLEHIYDDARALANLRALLKDDGKLVLSGPYWHDRPEHHVRIHSPRIIERMLRHHGFKVQKMISRGFLLNFYRLIHPAILFSHLVRHYLTGWIKLIELNHRLYRAILPIQSLPSLPYLDRLIFGQSGGVNGYVLWAKKDGSDHYDIVAMNRDAFKDTGSGPR